MTLNITVVSRSGIHQSADFRISRTEKDVLVKRDPLQVWVTERVRELVQLGSFR
jgi:hypothetical protein